MMPNVATSRPRAPALTASLRHAASLSNDAAMILAEEMAGSKESSRYVLVANRLANALVVENVSRLRLLSASPAVIERSGRTRTLIEMIEAEPGDDATRIRLAKLLLRVLTWSPDSVSSMAS